MNSSQIRHKNFHALFNDYIARHPDQPQRGMLKQFAQQLGLSDRYLSHIKCQRKNIGNSVARAIEPARNLPHVWMDREPTRPPRPRGAGVAEQLAGGSRACEDRSHAKERRRASRGTPRSPRARR